MHINVISEEQSHGMERTSKPTDNLSVFVNTYIRQSVC